MTDKLTIKATRPRVEQLLEVYRDSIGDDFGGYRNHVYRAITYAMHFLDYAEEHEPIVETIFVYHDIGLWTDRVLAYLEPSEELAVRDNRANGWGLDPEVLRAGIHWHHKIFSYKGPHAEIVDSCRKADWIDASKGWIRKGISRRAIQEAEAVFPNLGFHASLARLAKDYSGSLIVGGYRVTRGIVKW